MTEAGLTEAEAYAIGMEAYTYAYPMVVMEVSRRVCTNLAEPDGALLRAPVNRFTHASRYPDADFRDVVRPNADTLYSMLWFDVGTEPLVLSLPDTDGRYFVVPIMDQWTDVFATLGTRTTGRATGDYALVGQTWRGTLPADVRRIVSPTETGWIVVRIQTNGPEDFEHVRRLQEQVKAVPLSARGKPWNPPPHPVDPTIDVTTPPVVQVAGLSPDAFFALFAEALKRNPPHAADTAILLRMERIGLKAGESFDLGKADPRVRSALTRAAPDALTRIVKRGGSRYEVREGWSRPKGMLGAYGVDYFLRAYIAYSGLGALPPEEAIYPGGVLDSEGQRLNGASRYLLHFEKDRLPPVDAFWSLTMYGRDQFFVANPIERYAIGDRDALTYNPDGSLDIHIQHASPGPEKEANWLPAPEGPFDMNLRLYLPRPETTDGRWRPPGLVRLP